MRFFATIMLSCSLLTGIAAVEAATIYKWVDDSGQVHFGSRPSAEHSSEPFATKSHFPPATSPASRSDSMDSSSSEQKKIDAEVKRQVAKEQAELETYCTNMRNRLAQLMNNPRLLTEVNGEMVRLSEEQRQQRITEAKEKIAEHCE